MRKIRLLTMIVMILSVFEWNMDTHRVNRHLSLQRVVQNINLADFFVRFQEKERITLWPNLPLESSFTLSQK